MCSNLISKLDSFWKSILTNSTSYKKSVLQKCRTPENRLCWTRFPGAVQNRLIYLLDEGLNSPGSRVY